MKPEFAWGSWFFFSVITWAIFMKIGFIVLQCSSCVGGVHQQEMTWWCIISIPVAAAVVYLIIKKDLL